MSAPVAQASFEPTDAQLREVALSRAEYEEICRRLGRPPNAVELGMCGAMWSEHCGYKNSKPLLRRFGQIPAGERILVGAGEENAGAVDLGDGLAAIFKIESHNHPSAVEPFQGAATGVGGIVRDIFTMGARPVAILDSLRFGPPDDPHRGDRNRYLVEGVVGGVGSYGNCIGVPNVGGEVVFAPSYSENPLVNAMCVGIARAEQIVSSRATGNGNSVLLVGADTGRDGLHGATFASVDDPQASHRGVVQVGDPFREKLLIEACLEVLEAPWLVAMQDLGAAGLTSSTVECASKGGSGIEIDVSRVSRRETGMTPYEVMLSESQERMLVVVLRGHEAQAQAVFDRWGLHSDVIGKVTDGGLVRITDGGDVVAEPCPTRCSQTPRCTSGRGGGRPHPGPPGARPGRPPRSPGPGGDPAGAAGRPQHRQQAGRLPALRPDGADQHGAGPGGDAAVVRLKGTRAGRSGRSRWRRTATGATATSTPAWAGASPWPRRRATSPAPGPPPWRSTDCLNFGNPEKPAVYYQLQQAVEGMAEACAAVGAPVVSGNVSLYNESGGEPIYPTPIVGVLGLLEDVSRHCPSRFRGPGETIALLGETREEVGASEYLAQVHGLVAGRVPELDLEREAAVQRLVRGAIQAGLLRSAHDCADGGLAVALVESCSGPFGLPADDAAGAVPVIGARIDVPAEWREMRADAVLFGESQSRILVSLRPEHWEALVALARAESVPLYRLGETGGDRVAIAPYLDVPLATALERHATALEIALRTPVTPLRAAPQAIE